MRQRLAAGRVSSMSASEENELSEPGQAHNPGAPVQPRQAASVILLRDESSELELLRDEPNELELLLVKRTPKARFMGGVWVFPGGAVDAGEGDGEEAHRAGSDPRAAGGGGHRPGRSGRARSKFSRWITPAEVQIRFDTHFFLAALPAGQEPQVDGEECVEHGWFTPRRRTGGQPCRRDRAGLPDDQAPGAAERLPLGEGADRTCPRTRGPARAAAGADRRRGRPHRAARRARILSPAAAAAQETFAAQTCCCALTTCVTALISARCVNACG